MKLMGAIQSGQTFHVPVLLTGKVDRFAPDHKHPFLRGHISKVEVRFCDGSTFWTPILDLRNDDHELVTAQEVEKLLKSCIPNLTDREVFESAGLTDAEVDRELKRRQKLRIPRNSSL